MIIKINKINMKIRGLDRLLIRQTVIDDTKGRDIFIPQQAVTVVHRFVGGVWIEFSNSEAMSFADDKFKSITICKLNT